MFRIGQVEIKNPVVIAPLAGYTNIAYREIMKNMGAGLVYTEMISAKGLLYENEQTQDLTKMTTIEKPVTLQLFGGEIEDVVKAAIWVDQHTDCDIIDINMGCPVRKVLKANSGSKLLTDPQKVYHMVRGIVENVSKPVSVKIRAGWDHQSINAVEIAKTIEKAGASAIAIHGRTKSDLYGGKVNLDWIKMVKDAVSIPVIGNGDIRSVEDAVRMMEYTGVDGVMIGRGGLGNPWLVRDVVNFFEQRDHQSPPTREEKMRMCLHHFERLLEIKPERLAMLEMRSMAAWYSKGLAKSKEFKQQLMKAQSVDAMKSLINTFKMLELGSE